MNHERHIDGHVFNILIDRHEIDIAVQRLGKRLTTDYRGKNPIMVGVMNGAFLFIADLIRAMDEPEAEVDFLKIGSYGNHMSSSGLISLDKDVSAKLMGRHIIVVEDIVDSGLSITFIHDHIIKLQPASLEFATLLLKKEKAKVDFDIKYVGFEIGNDFVIGYGLDYQQQYRNLPDIYVTYS
jgi:hypoxanthine phosphoribosyltransferase